MSGDIFEQEEMDDNKFRHLGYRVSDLSDSLGAALGKDDKLSVSPKSIPNSDWPDLNYLIPSLHTTLVLIYFSMMVCILGGISSFMWKRFGISTKSQSKKEGIEKQLLGSGKYAQYVNAAVALKIYQHEMEKDSDSNSESDCKENVNENSSINESVLIGGYKKSKKLRARTIRKQKVREQKENYQRYKKRLEYEKQLKRHNKMKEKKYVKKRARKIKQENKNKKEKKNGNGRFWNAIYNSYNSVVGVFGKDNNEQNGLQINEEMTDYKKSTTKKCDQNVNKENKNDLEQMIICDCCNEIIIDLEKYYLDKIKSSDIYCEIVGDMKAFKKLIRSLAAKKEECEGLIDDELNVYFRWNCECDAKLRCYIENSGKCQVKQTGQKMLAISKEVFTVNI